MNTKIIKNEIDMHKYWIEQSKLYNKIILKWCLSAWKTTFTKWFARWLWIDEKIVQSPTYTYCNIYDNRLLHIDMYRLEKETELIDKWILDLIESFDKIIIEWPKFIDLYIDKDRIGFEIIIENEKNRIIKKYM